MAIVPGTCKTKAGGSVGLRSSSNIERTYLKHKNKSIIGILIEIALNP
jgi:hypothetical protein